MVPGWGLGGFGAILWGGGLGFGGLSVISADPVAENVVRVTFSEEPYSDGVGTVWDALADTHYVVAVVAGGVGLDGLLVRAVQAARVDLVAGDLASLDLLVDRPFSPYPCQYVVAVQGLRARTTGLPLVPGSASAQFHGLLRSVENSVQGSAVRSRDIASPQSPSATLDPLPSPGTAVLGSFNVNAAGDYAVDEGLTGYKKRIFRRIYCRPRRFVFLPPEWGLGVQDDLKKLNIPARRESMRADIQSQVMQEPETAECDVSVLVDPTIPALVWYHIQAKTRDNRQLDIDLPFYVGE